jgi:hypothetical protein
MFELADTKEIEKNEMKKEGRDPARAKAIAAKALAAVDASAEPAAPTG